MNYVSSQGQRQVAHPTHSTYRNHQVHINPSPREALGSRLFRSITSRKTQLKCKSIYLRVQLPHEKPKQDTSPNSDTSAHGACARAGAAAAAVGGRGAALCRFCQSRQDLTEPTGEAGGAPVKMRLRKGKTQQGREEKPVRDGPGSTEV